MISITFTDDIERIISTDHLYQWDMGQILKINNLSVGSPKIHFTNKGLKTGISVQSEIIDDQIVCTIPGGVFRSKNSLLKY